jgi:predicted PurR-regulated permease PerM
MKGKWHRVEQIAGIVFLALIGFGCFVVLRPFVTAILWAAILCFATWPLHLRLERLVRGRKTLAAALMTTLIAMVVVLPFALVGMSFADDVARLAKRLHEYSNQGLPPAPEWASRLPIVGERLATYWGSLHGDAELATKTLRTWFDKITPWLLSWGISLGEGILQMTLSLVIAFFFYRDGPTVAARIDEGIKRIAGDYAQHLMETVGTTIKCVVYGLLGTALAQGILAGIGFLIAGIPGAFLLALFTFLLSLVPGGPPFVWIPATAWLFFQGHPGWGIFLAIWGFLCVSGIDNVIRPMLISRGGTLPFALTLLGVLGGIVAFGFIGLFLGPTLLAAGYSVVQAFLKRSPVSQEPPAGAARKQA